MGLSLDKVGDEAPELLPTAEATKITLEKRNLDGLTASVALVLDYSGSMGRLYTSGAVQAFSEKVLAIATQLDDDGEIDIYIFASKADYLGTLNLANFRTGIADLTRGYRMGTTDYAGVIDLVTSRNSSAPKRSLFGRPKPTGPAANPVLALFVTDGQPDSQAAAEKSLTASSFHPIFWKFLSIGPKISFLERLDALTGRDVDNASYSAVSSIAGLKDADLLDMLLDEYPTWVAEQRQRGAIQ
jgi:hypothetical protein